MRKILGGFALLLISITTKMSGELLVVIIPSGVALLIAVLGIFQDSLRLRLMGPRLKVHFEMSEPFVGTARIREAAVPSPPRSFLFRVGVANLGKSAAWRVSVLLTGLEKYNEEARRYEVEEWFVPVELAWCHGVGSQLQVLNPHSTIYFDLGHYEHAEFPGDSPEDFDSPNATQFVLKTSRIDARQWGYVLTERQYQLRIQVTAANAEPVEAWFHVSSLPGWSDNIENLIRHGHMRIALLGQRPQSLVGAVEEHFRREMSVNS
jgi:hypothetical protein